MKSRAARDSEKPKYCWYARTAAYTSSSTRVLSSLRYGVLGRAIATPAEEKAPSPKARRNPRRLSRPGGMRRWGGLAQGPGVLADGLAVGYGTPSAVSSQFSSRQAPAAIPATRSGLAFWSCGGLPAKHAQRVRFNCYCVLDYRKPPCRFAHSAIALRTVPSDVQIPILDGEPGLQIGAGNAYMAVRGITPWAGCACATAWNWPAESVSIGLAHGLLASTSVVGTHAAACSVVPRRYAHCAARSGRSSSQVTAPPVAISMSGQRSAGNCRFPSRQKQTACGVTPRVAAMREGPPQSSIALLIAFMSKFYTCRTQEINRCFCPSFYMCLLFSHGTRRTNQVPPGQTRPHS